MSDWFSTAVEMQRAILRAQRAQMDAAHPPFALSLSKGHSFSFNVSRKERCFDKLSTNGERASLQSRGLK